jgi:hypothetical protein
MDIDHTCSPAQIASYLVGKTIRYYVGKGRSSVVLGAIRVLKIENVDKVGTNKKDETYVTVFCKDIDDAGEGKYRNLILDCIELAL